MYAPAHVSTALVVKKRYPMASLFGLIVATQAIELLWVVLSYLGIEHPSVTRNGVLHLDYLPYSHSVLTGLGIAVVGWFVVARIFGHKQLGIAFGLALGSHIMLDIIQHEPNIRLAWFLTNPTLGFNLGAIPLLDFAIETAYAVFCWWYFGGSKKLLAVLLALSLTNLPLMLTGEGSATSLATNHFILPTVILGQILMTFGLVYVAARSRGNQLGAVEAVPVDRLDAIQIPA